MLGKVGFFDETITPYFPYNVVLSYDLALCFAKDAQDSRGLIVERDLDTGFQQSARNGIKMKFSKLVLHRLAWPKEICNVVRSNFRSMIKFPRSVVPASKWSRRKRKDEAEDAL